MQKRHQPLWMPARLAEPNWPSASQPTPSLPRCSLIIQGLSKQAMVAAHNSNLWGSCESVQVRGGHQRCDSTTLQPCKLLPFFTCTANPRSVNVLCSCTHTSNPLPHQALFKTLDTAQACASGPDEASCGARAPLCRWAPGASQSSPDASPSAPGGCISTRALQLVAAGARLGPPYEAAAAACWGAATAEACAAAGGAAELDRSTYSDLAASPIFLRGGAPVSARIPGVSTTAAGGGTPAASAARRPAAFDAVSAALLGAVCFAFAL